MRTSKQVSYDLKFPQALFTVFILSYFLRFTSRIPTLGVVRFELLLGGLLLLIVLFSHIKDKFLFLERPSKTIILFFFYVLLSLPFVTWPGSVIQFHLVDWLKVFFLFIAIVATSRTEGQLKWVIGVFLACQTVRILEPLYLHITIGYWGDVAHSSVGGFSSLNRLRSAPHDVVNSNQLAWVINNTVPFLFYLGWKSGLIGKILTLMLAPMFFYCLLLTGSRSGLLTFIFILLTIVLFSKRKIRNFIVTVAIAIPIGLFAFGALGGDMQTRYLSLVDDSVAGADTAQGRIDGIIKGIGSISNNPLFGNGLGTSRETNFNIVGGRAQITHNLYLEIFQETGLIGFTLFMMYIVAIFKSLMETKRLLIAAGRDETDWLYRMATAVQVWVVMDLFYSLSCFGLRSWEWYFFGGVATVCLALAREQAADQVVPEQGRAVGFRMKKPAMRLAGSVNKS